MPLSLSSIYLRAMTDRVFERLVTEIKFEDDSDKERAMTLTEKKQLAENLARDMLSVIGDHLKAASTDIGSVK